MPWEWKFLVVFHQAMKLLFPSQENNSPQSSICFHFEKGGNKKYVKYTAASETCEEHKHKRVSIVHTGNAINFIESILLL